MQESNEMFWLWNLLGRFHPLIVHFPISLLWLAFVLELISWRKKSEAFKPAMHILLWIASVGAGLAVVFGLLLAQQDDYEGHLIQWHQWSGYATLLLSWLTLFSFKTGEIKSFRLLLFLSVIGVSFAGHFGAMMTHGENYLNLNSTEITQKLPKDTLTTIDKVDVKKLDPIQSNELNLSIAAKQILKNRCVDCHGPEKSKGKLRLDDIAYILKGGKEGPALVIGHPEKSEIIRRVKLPKSHDDAMPTKGKRVPAAEIKTLELWIQHGAIWPGSKSVAISTSASKTVVASEISPEIKTQKPQSTSNHSFFTKGSSADVVLDARPTDSFKPTEVLNKNQLQELNVNVRSILAHNCYSCHNATKTKGGLRLDKKEFIFKGGENGPILVVGNAEKSDMIRRVKLPAGHDDAMPTKGKRLTKEDVAMLEYWIKQGAPWPDGPERSIYKVAELAPRLPLVPKATPALKNPIDLFTDVYFKKHKITWKKPIDDRTFIRRASLDVVGLIPSPEAINEFIKDTKANKRELLITSLLNNQMAYTQHWLTFWNDALRNDYSGTGYITNGRYSISKWLYSSLKNNKPYDQLAKELISPTKESEGFIRGIEWRGTINSSQSTQMQAAQNVSQILLGLNLKCASCHDSFISDWKLDDAYAFANVFSEKPLEIHRCDLPTGRIAGQGVLFNSLGTIKESKITAERLVQLSNILVQKKNGRLYRTMVNRIWAQFMGRGIIEPVDVMDNEPWSQDLLDWLAYDFANNGTDLKKLMFQILTSKIYQSPAEGIKDAQLLTASNYVFKGILKRRITAEQFADAVSQSFYPIYSDSALATKMLPTDIKKEIPFARASLVKNDPFLTALGRPNREQVSTSRISQANLLQALELTNGSKFNQTLRKGAAIWVAKYESSESLIRALYQKALGREPSVKELNLAVRFMGKKPSVEGIQDLVWAVTLLPEFQLII